MASDSRRFSFSLAFFLLSALVVTSTCARTVDGRKKTASDHMIISVESLSPREECTVTSQDAGRRPGLKVVSRHGPCSSNRQNITLLQVLNQDRIRVNWIRSKITGKSQQATASPPKLLAGAAEIPANSGDSFGVGEYVVTVGFGTPGLQQTVLFDTGSDVTWIQCQPCVKSCYQQQEQIFDPTQSSTYQNISCTSPYCSSTELSWYNCTASGDTCVYLVRYGDHSFTQGYYSTDVLALTSSDTIQNFRFGCGENQGSTVNGPINGKLAGLMGLGRAPSSIVMQTKSTYGGVFSYCLPPTSSSTGYLAFGNGSVPSNVQYTPMLTADGSSFYFLQLISISVAGTKLAISPTVFSNAGTFIDSGTTITGLPPTAYSELRTAFMAQMTQYNMSQGATGNDTCYDFTGQSSVTLPSVVLEFEGVSMDLDYNGILYQISPSQSCLAFSPNGADADLTVIGNVNQRTFSVVYDVPNLLIGFGPKGC